MKPTDRYFHKLENIRLAERILLVKPDSQISNRSLTKFFKEHQLYQSNIRKLSNPTSSSRYDKEKYLKRNKWKD